MPSKLEFDQKGSEGKLPSPIENIIDLFSDVRPQSQELSIDPVQGSFKEVSLSGIFTVKQFKELKYTVEMLLHTNNNYLSKPV